MFGMRRNAVATPPNPWKVPTSTLGREVVTRRQSRGAFLLGVLSSAALVATFLAIGSAASAASTSNQWKLGFYNAKGNGFVFKDAPTGSFGFTKQASTCADPTSYATCGSIGAGTALDLTNKSTVVGNQSENTITATFTINGAVGAFTYGGEPYPGIGAGGALPNARLYFDSASIVGGGTFASTNYWWADDSSASAVLANNTFTVTALLDPTSASWSAYNGEPSGSYAAAFNAAASNIRDIGLSFGGGDFFANGVGTTDGTGSFTLTSLTVTHT
jgi:hypothetical protein